MTPYIPRVETNKSKDSKAPATIATAIQLADATSTTFPPKVHWIVVLMRGKILPQRRWFEHAISCWCLLPIFTGQLWNFRGICKKFHLFDAWKRNYDPKKNQQFASENVPKPPKGNRIVSLYHQFSGVNSLLVSGECTSLILDLLVQWLDIVKNIPRMVAKKGDSLW